MKNYIKYFSVIVISFLMFACSGNQDKAADNTKGDIANPAQAESDESKHTERPEYDFRKARWGMTKEEVKANEPGELLFDKENTLEYRVFIQKIMAQVSYKFKDGELIRGGYYFPKKYENKNDYITAYETIKEMIIKAKGSPDLDKIVPLNPSVEIDPDQKGQAVCDGKLIYGSQWNYPGSDIQLLFRGENGQCYLTVNYLKSIKNSPMKNQEHASEESEDENKVTN